MKKTTLLPILISLLSSPLFAGNQTNNGDLQFLQNNGQWQQPVIFAAAAEGAVVYFENNGFTWDFSNMNTLKNCGFESNVQSVLRGHAFKMNFTGGNSPAQITGKNEVSNADGISFSKIQYSEIYDGVNLSVYGGDNLISYDFMIAPHHFPRNIRIMFDGVSDMKIVEGNLEITTSVAVITEIKPLAYQIINGERIDITCQFQLVNGELSYIFPYGHYTDHELIIQQSANAVYEYNTSCGSGIITDSYPVFMGAYEKNWTEEIMADAKTDKGGIPEELHSLLPSVISIYPNPVTNGLLTLQLNSPEEMTIDIFVTDSHGREIYAMKSNHIHTGEQIFQIRLPELASGIYFISLSSDAAITIKQFVILN